MSDLLSLNRVYTLCKPEGDSHAPLFFDSPHSGQTYPNDFAYACQKTQLDSLSDLYVDQLFSHVISQGAYLLKAEFPRSYVDVNRHEDDIDTQLVDGLWTKPLYQKGRANAGYGVVYRLVKGEPIYESRLSPEVITQRLRNYYQPYHQAMHDTLQNIQAQFGCSYHINCHSMPSAHRFIDLPDIVLSDRNGSSCSLSFIEYFKELFTEKNYSVTINHPYKGAEILRKYGQPTLEMHSLQIEINRSLYMNEETLQKNKGFVKLQKDIEYITGQLSETLKNSCAKLLAAD